MSETTPRSRERAVIEASKDIVEHVVHLTTEVYKLREECERMRVAADLRSATVEDLAAAVRIVQRAADDPQCRLFEYRDRMKDLVRQIEDRNEKKVQP